MSIYTFLTPYSHVNVSENIGTPKSSILIGFSIKTIHFGVPLFLETTMYISIFTVYNIYTRVICHVSPRYYRQLTVFNISPPPLSFFSLHQLFLLGWFQEVRNSDTKTSVPWSCSCRSFLLDDVSSKNNLAKHRQFNSSLESFFFLVVILKHVF